jgi:hypothetical protein
MTRTFTEECQRAVIVSLREQLRKAHQEAQQWEDETCLEIDELDSIIDGQQEFIKTLQAQLHNTLERKLQMSFAIDAAKQEVDQWKHSHADACDMNRRLCLDLEKAEGEAHELGRQLHNAWANNRKQDQWLEESKKEAAHYKQACTHMTERGDIFAKKLEDAKQEAATQRAIADNAMDRAARAEQANLGLLDQLQAAEAKVEWYTEHCGTIEHLEKAIQFANECREKHW